jgi:hypothetical protein
LGIYWKFRIWWERVTPKSKLKILNHEKPVDELVKAVVHEFYGDIKIRYKSFC